ncbi:uncharacterized protein LOC129586273 isoform X2 [Paramacrobiotus metropolitanus]|uniref:uncharacterized protein LOC129586273 isoform X2 n=1 Tax=Paramacrobiotus metropolitanus TaxID=2943436 RepID=UPI00244584EA|nr:uncharacterized protein LOC129586273 isoform X2 [Paramacrobiotus metropolitanus]
MFTIMDVSLSSVIVAFNFGAHPMHHDHVCSACTAGHGLKSFCNSTHDTVCEPCEAGRSFSSSYLHMNKCQPCSLCGPLLFIDRKCSVLSDTSCESCETIRRPHTWEYFRSCLAFHDNEPQSQRNVKLYLMQKQIAEMRNDNHDLTDQENIDLELMQEELHLRNEFDKLKAVVAEEMADIKELGSAVNHVMEKNFDKSKLVAGQISQKDDINLADTYEKNPQAVLIIVLLSTFALLGLGTVIGIIILISVNKKASSAKTYGGVSISDDGATLLQIEQELTEEDIDASLM